MSDQEEAESARKPNFDRLVLDAIEVARMLGISRAATYKAMNCGDIPSIRIGGRRLVLRAPFLRTLDGSGFGGTNRSAA